jgi:transcriptional regulator with XRE-family HTH domain
MGLTETALFSRACMPDKYDSLVSSDEYEQILQELARWCEIRGRKQQLAREMNVSHGLVSLWLSGRRPLSLKQWIAIKKIIRRKTKKPG